MLNVPVYTFYHLAHATHLTMIIIAYLKHCFKSLVYRCWGLMRDLCCWDYAASNVEGCPTYRHTFQLPSTGLMTLGTVWYLLHSSGVTSVSGDEAVIG
jgi:hypothetical protein